MKQWIRIDYKNCILMQNYWINSTIFFEIHSVNLSKITTMHLFVQILKLFNAHLYICCICFMHCGALLCFVVLCRVRNFFSINSTLGKITVTRLPDVDADEMDLIIVASDGGTPSLKSTSVLKVRSFVLLEFFPDHWCVIVQLIWIKVIHN